MERGIYVALSGALAMERRLEVTANNIANANTTAFKIDNTAFNVAVPSQPPSTNGTLSTVPVSSILPVQAPNMFSDKVLKDTLSVESNRGGLT